VVVERKGDAVASDTCDCPVLLVIAYEATMESIDAVVLVLRDVRGLAIDCERAILDSAKLVRSWISF
jgi:hypothetical protein